MKKWKGKESHYSIRECSRRRRRRRRRRRMEEACRSLWLAILGELGGGLWRILKTKRERKKKEKKKDFLQQKQNKTNKQTNSWILWTALVNFSEKERGEKDLMIVDRDSNSPKTKCSLLRWTEEEKETTTKQPAHFDLFVLILGNGVHYSGSKVGNKSSNSKRQGEKGSFLLDLGCN